MTSARKKCFIVQVREVHIQSIQVEADSEQGAIQAVANGEGDSLERFEYSHTLEPETWTVEELLK